MFKNLGRTGVKVSPLCLGTLNFGGPTSETDSIRIIHKAIAAGINFIDTANFYQKTESERIVGNSLAGGLRAKVILATKFHFPLSDDPNDRGNSRRHIMSAVENSLRRLQTDWIDLYQVHRPSFDIPHDETLRALDDLVRQGKVRYIGSSSHPAWFVMEGIALSEKYGWARYISEQPPYNLLDRRIENELIPLAERYGLAIIPWSPLAMGMLAGRYRNHAKPPKGSRVEQVGWVYRERVTEKAVKKSIEFVNFAEANGFDPAQLALLWAKSQKGVTSPIIGPRLELHLDAALAILEQDLPYEIALKLDKIFPPGSSTANFHNNSGWVRS